MPRPRLHDLDQLLDTAEQLVASSGIGDLTLRGLAQAAGVSNGSIYHAFASKEELLARLWVRTSDRVLATMLERMASARSGGADSAVDAVVAVALTPLELIRVRPDAARIFFSHRREQLVSTTLPNDVRGALDDVQRRFTAALIDLADGVWGRRDRIAVAAITACVVDLPSGLLRRQLFDERGVDPHTEERIAAAVRAILQLPLPEAPSGRPARPGSTRKEPTR